MEIFVALTALVTFQQAESFQGRGTDRHKTHQAIPLDKQTPDSQMCSVQMCILFTILN